MRPSPRLPWLSLSVLTVLLLPAPRAAATPGPDSVVVVANSTLAGSVTLSERYAEARAVPAAQVCLLDLPDAEDIDLATFQDDLLTPLRDCLDETPGVRERIEAAVLMRGVPLRVRVPVDGGQQLVSLAAALALWDSESAGMPVLGRAPGAPGNCGDTPCLAAAWGNPYRGLPFEADWSRSAGGVIWRPLLVTMLHARSDQEAAQLLESAIAAEANGPSEAPFLFMDGRDPARGVLDAQYDAVIAALTERGIAAERTAFDADLTGRTLAGLLTGTATLGETIEGNAYAPGSIVDNLTSLGAVPVNFRPEGEAQVSIARWVEQGVAGVHGAVAEPLNNSFPNRRLVIEYVDGATLAEAFHAAMPFVYWRNLVLGDPMAAPYAVRPTLTVDGMEDGATLDGPTRLRVSAGDARGRGVDSLLVLQDGVELARVDDDALELCFAPESAGPTELLIVARAADDLENDRYVWRPKGWMRLRVRAAGGGGQCPVAMPDAGVDAGVARDAGTGEEATSGCAAGPKQANDLWPMLLALVFLRRRRC